MNRRGSLREDVYVFRTYKRRGRGTVVHTRTHLFRCVLSYTTEEDYLRPVIKRYTFKYWLKVETIISLVKGMGVSVRT